MREALPDDVALLSLAQDYRAPELAVLLGVQTPDRFRAIGRYTRKA